MGLDKIIEILIRNSCITSYELTKLGYIDEDITELINDGYLRRKERGVYILGNPEILLEYAESIEKRNFEFSKKVKDYYEMITGVNINPYLERFEKGIQDKSYLDIITNYRIIDSFLSRDSETLKDSNLYLLLISYLYELDDEYKERIDNLNLEDILLTADDDITKLENKLRKDLFFKSFYEAKASFKKKISMQKDFSLEDKIEKDLIASSIEKYRKFKEEVISLIDKNSFKKLLEVLYKEEDMNFLNVKGSYLLKTVVDYLEIEKTKKVPYVMRESANTFQSIKNKDYKKALEYMDKYKNEKNINYQDTLYLMLQKINELIETIEKSNEETLEKVEVKKKKEEKKPVVEKIKTTAVSISDSGNKGKSILTKAVEERLEEKPIVNKEKKIELENKDIKRLEKQIQEIYSGNKVVHIVEKIDPSKNDLVLEYLKQFRELDAFKIGEKDKSKVVLRSRPYIKEKYDIFELVNEAKDCLYRERNYTKAEELYRLLLQIGNPRDVTYGDYGITLLKLHRRREAIPYLEIATALSKEQGHSLDYSDLILELDRSIPESQKKPKFRMREEDFCESKTFNLKLDYLDDLVNLVLEDEIDLEDAMTRLGLDEENKNYIRLICARDCYYEKKYKDGDKYVLSVEKSSEKTYNVKRILRVVKETRKYYKNRLNRDEENQLVFRK